MRHFRFRVYRVGHLFIHRHRAGGIFIQNARRGAYFCATWNIFYSGGTICDIVISRGTEWGYAAKDRSGRYLFAR